MRRLLLILSIPIVAVACGRNTGTGTTPAPTISVTAPSDGATILGSRSLLVTGSVTGTGVSVSLRANGGTAVAAPVSGGTFSAQVTLRDRDNTIVATATNAGGSATATVQVSYPFVTLTTFQAAERVIGQADKTAWDVNQGGGVAAGTVNAPYGSAAWDGARLFLPDSGNNRVLAFAGVPATDGAAAAFAVGQDDLSSSAAAVSAAGLIAPTTVRVAGGKLFVAEWSLDDAVDRILIRDAVPTAPGSAATVAVGAEGLDQSGAGACDAESLSQVQGFFVVGSRLIVADSGNHRVLIWNTIPTQSGVTPDVVLGQSSFTRCEANAGGAATLSTLNYPTDVWSDGTRLYVADLENGRILGWNTIPTTTRAADFALGAIETFSMSPYMLTSNGNQLFVADLFNYRVLVWNSLPTSTVAPDVVLGQGSLAGITPNDDDQDDLPDANPTARTLNWPTGVAVLPDALVVTDNSNNRFLVFRGQ
jgi:hypothetical protein